MTASQCDLPAAVVAAAEPVTHSICGALTACASDIERLALACLLIGFIDGHEPHALETYVENGANRTLSDAVRLAVATVREASMRDLANAAGLHQKRCDQCQHPIKAWGRRDTDPGPPNESGGLLPWRCLQCGGTLPRDTSPIDALGNPVARPLKGTTLK